MGRLRREDKRRIPPHTRSESTYLRRGEKSYAGRHGKPKVLGERRGAVTANRSVSREGAKGERVNLRPKKGWAAGRNGGREEEKLNHLMGGEKSAKKESGGRHRWSGILSKRSALS